MIRLIAHVSSAVLDSAPFEQRMSGILSCVATAFESDASVIRELQKSSLQLLAATGVDKSMLPSTMAAREGIAGTMLKSRRGIIINDVPRDPITANIHAAATGRYFTFAHYAGAPMLVEGSAVGVLGIYRVTAGPNYTPSDLAYLEIVANELAVALQNNRLYRQQVAQSELLAREVKNRKRAEKKLQKQLARAESLAESNQRLIKDLQIALRKISDSYDVTLQGWCAALDLRDVGTMGHTKRVAELAERLAIHLGYPTDAIPNLRRGALLHDIGKIGIPDSILLKDGPLSQKETMVMQRHPELAYEFLSGVEFLQAATDIPLCHHERWDGKGYPRGLRGAEIPLAARIFAVVDVWDALQSDRPYRRAWSLEKITEHVRENSGTHFDPEIAEAFLQMLPEINSDQ